MIRPWVQILIIKFFNWLFLLINSNSIFYSIQQFKEPSNLNQFLEPCYLQQQRKSTIKTILKEKNETSSKPNQKMKEKKNPALWKIETQEKREEEKFEENKRGKKFQLKKDWSEMEEKKGGEEKKVRNDWKMSRGKAWLGMYKKDLFYF